MSRRSSLMTAALALAAAAGAGCAAAGPPPESRGASVIVVTVDGTRWQEIFRGADPELAERRKPGTEPERSGEEFWQGAPEDRRRALAPFLWGTVAREGQLLGNLDWGSGILVTNRFKISYPGYHELLSGFASETIDSNRKIPNPDPTVFEFLQGRPGF